jgi:hypothetical protein
MLQRILRVLLGFRDWTAEERHYLASDEKWSECERYARSIIEQLKTRYPQGYALLCDMYRELPDIPDRSHDASEGPHR